jgi:hypothetical protein
MFDLPQHKKTRRTKLSDADIVLELLWDLGSSAGRQAACGKIHKCIRDKKKCNMFTQNTIHRSRDKVLWPSSVTEVSFAMCRSPRSGNGTSSAGVPTCHVCVLLSCVELTCSLSDRARLRGIWVDAE